MGGDIIVIMRVLINAFRIAVVKKQFTKAHTLFQITWAI